MHRSLPWLVGAQMLGVVCADRGVSLAPWSVPIILLCVAIAFVMAHRSAWLPLAAMTAAFFSIGGLALDARQLPAALDTGWPVGARATIEARVAEVRSAGDRVRLELGAVEAVSGRPASRTPWPGRIRLHVGVDEPAHGFFRMRRTGEQLRLRVSIRPIDGPRNPGARDPRPASRRRGVWANASLAHPDAYVLIGARVAAPPGWPATARHSLAARRQAAVDRLVGYGRGGALLAALGLGASDVLDPELRRDLGRLGLSHLVAVSGLHLAMVAALGFMAAGLTVRLTRAGVSIDPAPWKGAAAVVAALAYAGLSGFGVPARRALVLLVVAIALHATGRRSAWLSAWCIAAASVLAVDPAALFELGPQLSFGVTAALASARLDVAEPPPEGASPLPRGLATVLRLFEVSAVALAASAWVLSIHGRPSTGWSLLANAVAVPVTAFGLLPTALFAGGLGFMGVEGPWIDAALGVSAAGVAALESSVRVVASLVEAPLAPPQPGVISLLAAAGCVVIAVRVPAPSLRGVAALCCVALLGAGDDRSPGAGRAAPPAGPELVAFDVGQGDALLVRDGSTAILVDAGWSDPLGGWDAGARVVVPGLRALGVRRIDLLVVTHGDLDHRGGVGAVLDALEVERVWVPQPTAHEPAFEALRAHARSRGARFEARARSERRHHVGAFEIEVLWPPEGHARATPNESSLVLRVGAGDVRVLLMGDAGFETERALLSAGDPLAALVLKLGHHGSRTATSEAFLRAVRPAWALVSAGCSVGRTLPHDDALERVAREGGRVLWTGRDGAVGLALEAPVHALALAPEPSTRRCRADHDSASTLPLWEPSRRVDRPGNAAPGPGVGRGHPEAGR